MDDDEIYIDRDKTADYMNNFFATIGPKLAEGFIDQWNFEGVESQVELQDFQIEEEEVNLAIKNIKVTKSSAVDGLSTKVLKIAFKTLSKQLTYLFNNVPTKRMYPESLEKSHCHSTTKRRKQTQSQ